jgi:hypothetical protein
MQPMRTRVRYVAAIGLLMQLTVLAVTPLALCCSSPAPSTLVAAENKDEACCEGLGPGQVCPMHHHTKPSGHAHQAKRSSDLSCTMRNACKAPDLALLSVLSGALAPASVSFSFDLSSSPVALTQVDLLTRDLIPDTPPPRA